MSHKPNKSKRERRREEKWREEIIKEEKVAERITWYLNTIWKVIAVALVVFLGPSIYFGGEPAGIVNGKYLLVSSSHEGDKYTIVSKNVYTWVENTYGWFWVILAPCIPVIFILTFWRDIILNRPPRQRKSLF